MKVALVHDYIKEYGGAERVLEALHEIFPEAPVYTSVYLPKYLGPHKERFRNWTIKTSIAQHLPFKAKLISPLRLFAPFLFSHFDFSEYDLVIVSATGAYIPNSIKCHPERKRRILDSSSRRYVGTQNDNRRKPIHVCYCHTPPRYLYGYATAREWKKNIIFRILGELANHFLRQVDYKSSENVDYFIANSENVRARIRKFYRRDSVVVYPPVELASSNLASSVQLKINKKLNADQLDAKRYFLAGGRLARPKHIDLIVKTCERLKVQLKVFGRGFAGYDEKFKVQPFDSAQDKSSKFKVNGGSPKIQFFGEVTDQEKFVLMKNAKAFIMASEDEDFGITPVEAMAQGTPVIAYRSGGVVESVIEEKTGIFFDKLTEESLSGAIKKFNNLQINSKDCLVQAEKFSEERFKKEIKKLVEAFLKKHI